MCHVTSFLRPQAINSTPHPTTSVATHHRKMQLRIEEPAIILPITPPFDHNNDHLLSLSHLDTDRNLHVTLRYLRIYPNTTPQNSDPFHVITTALSSALLHYYPLAGTLRRRSLDSRLELHCRAGDGLPVVNAVTSASLTTDAVSSLAEQLAPDPDPNEDPIRPMVLQITKFSCGGFVLGAAVHHAICDGVGATLFFSAVAELARGSGRIGVNPVWERSVLLGPRKPPRVVYPIHEVMNLEKEFSLYAGSGKRVVKEYLDVEEEWLDRVKGLLYKQTGLKFTTFDALGAFIWSARESGSKRESNICIFNEHQKHSKTTTPLRLLGQRMRPGLRSPHGGGGGGAARVGDRCGHQEEQAERDERVWNGRVEKPESTPEGETES